MTGNVKSLPAGYEKIRDIDLKKNKREALIVNVAAAIIAVVMALIGHAFVPISALFDMSSLPAYFARFIVMIAALFAYIVLHEAVHGVVMYHYCKVRPSFGFTGMYAYAGSTAYYTRRSYIVIALAPVVVWGIVLAFITPFCSPSWFWVVYFVQISNFSGAAGDLYVTSLMMKMPADILVCDAGVSMAVYGRK